MNKYRVAPLKMSHLADLRDTCREAEFAIPLLSADVLKHSTGLTLLCDRKPIACGGILSPSSGLGVTWLFTVGATDAREGTTILRHILSGFRRLAREGKYRRIEALVLEDFAIARRVVEILGFEYCCTKDLYGPQGQTFYEYVWRAPK